ncbi:hypothetical protein Ddye_014812 [Dipteronia dyeriana]|uniref:Zinc knuckle CX2CX4HX4C domain-containing protein n=1 Tax=Dipteronia dyeriana TaxID=168575 RepID=A0AAD9U4C8_9ROSI|nr:hypothetical protein Ddye_014812 [Dipteronia dyeriana]
MNEAEIAKLYENLSLTGEDRAVHEMIEKANVDGVEDVNRCVVGKVLTKSEECWGKIMRVKIRIDISKPSKGWLRLKLGKTDEVTIVSLKYKRLSEFCFSCGKIGHGIKVCMDDEDRKAALEGSLNKFGSCLKTPISERSKAKVNIQVNGRSSSNRTRSIEASHETEGDRVC